MARGRRLLPDAAVLDRGVRKLEGFVALELCVLLVGVLSRRFARGVVWRSFGVRGTALDAWRFDGEALAPELKGCSVLGVHERRSIRSLRSAARSATGSLEGSGEPKVRNSALATRLVAEEASVVEAYVGGIVPAR